MNMCFIKLVPKIIFKITQIFLHKSSPSLEIKKNGWSYKLTCESWSVTENLYTDESVLTFLLIVVSYGTERNCGSNWFLYTLIVTDAVLVPALDGMPRSRTCTVS